MPCSAASFPPLTAALICMSARYAKNWATLTVTSTSKRCEAWATFLRGRVRPKRAHHEKPVPENLPFVLAGHRVVRGARDFSGHGLSPAAQSHLGVVAQHRPG